MTLGFLGTQYLSLDVKGRLALPTRHRDALESMVIVTVDMQAACLVLYPQQEWSIVSEKVRSLPSMKPEVKRFQRRFFGYASELEIDASGRILLPAPLREYAKLEKRVALVGQGSKLELWNDELWAAESGEDALIGDSIPEELANLVL